MIKNNVPRGQERNLADPIDMFYIDLLDQSEPINLPVFMISRIGRIANTAKDHGIWFLLTSVFEKHGILL